jgi:hypothetical protein
MGLLLQQPQQDPLPHFIKPVLGQASNHGHADSWTPTQTTDKGLPKWSMTVEVPHGDQRCFDSREHEVVG